MRASVPSGLVSTRPVRPNTVSAIRNRPETSNTGALTAPNPSLPPLFSTENPRSRVSAISAPRVARSRGALGRPELPVYLAQFMASMDEPTTRPQVGEQIAALRQRLGALCDVTISDAAIRHSIAAYNRNRGLLRKVYDLRRRGRIALGSRQMQVLIKSSMVMDVEEHTAILTRLVGLLETHPQVPEGQVRLHLSGHFCHAPRPELLDMIESCGVTVVDDDVFTGYRYIATDVPDRPDPIQALTQWYFDRNSNVPCSTRAQKTVDWETYLLDSLKRSGAQGVVVLVAKFCEPHMLYYPELRKALHREGIPHLLIETEHEGLALEMLKTRVEALVEGIRRPRVATAHALS